jgi:phosphohistidine phosphatase
MKHLTLIRHAKAVDAANDEDDHDRVLRGRGRRAAAEIGAQLAAVPPDLVLSSTAARTRETVECAVAGWPHRPAILYEQELYLVSAARLLRRLELIEPEIGAVWIVGHNPGIHELARQLAARASGAGRFPDLMQRFPTGARAVFAIDADRWRALVHAKLELLDYVLPTLE